MRKSELCYTLGRVINDAVMIFFALMAAYFLRMKWFALIALDPPTTLYSIEAFQSFSIQSTLFLIIVMALNGRYRFYTDEKVWDELYNVFWAFSAGFALLVVYFFFIKFIFFSRFILGSSWVLGLLFTMVGRVGLRWIRTQFYERNIGKQKVLILGTGKLARQCIADLQQNPKYDILGVISEKKTDQKTFEKFPLLGHFQQLSTLLKEQTPHEIILTTDEATEQISHDLLRIAHRHHVQFRYIPDEVGLDLASVKVSTLGQLPIISLQNTRMDGWAYIIKSTLDYCAALIFSCILLPVFLVIAFLIKKENPSAPIFYCSDRVGRRGKTFKCVKFRTMIPDADKKKEKLLKKNERKGGVLFKVKDDPRITKLGKTLRIWSLDEIPNLWNVLKGDMSLIGPRPHLPEEVEKYGKNDLQILSIKPGMTGFAQINGRSSLEFEEEMRYELFYMKNWSLWLDSIIFIKTILIVLKRENVS